MWNLFTKHAEICVIDWLPPLWLNNNYLQTIDRERGGLFESFVASFKNPFVWRHFNIYSTCFINEPQLYHQQSRTHAKSCVTTKLRDFYSEIFFGQIFTHTHTHNLYTTNSLTHDNKWEVIYILKIIFRYCLFQALLTSKLIYLRPLITSRRAMKKREYISYTNTVYIHTARTLEDAPCERKLFWHSSMFSKLISFPTLDGTCVCDPWGNFMHTRREKKTQERKEETKRRLRWWHFSGVREKNFFQRNNNPKFLRLTNLYTQTDEYLCPFSSYSSIPSFSPTISSHHSLPPSSLYCYTV